MLEPLDANYYPPPQARRSPANYYLPTQARRSPYPANQSEIPTTPREGHIRSPHPTTQSGRQSRSPYPTTQSGRQSRSPYPTTQSDGQNRHPFPSEGGYNKSPYIPCEGDRESIFQNQKAQEKLSYRYAESVSSFPPHDGPTYSSQQTNRNSSDQCADGGSSYPLQYIDNTSNFKPQESRLSYPPQNDDSISAYPSRNNEELPPLVSPRDIYPTPLQEGRTSSVVVGRIDAGYQDTADAAQNAAANTYDTAANAHDTAVVVQNTAAFTHDTFYNAQDSAVTAHDTAATLLDNAVTEQDTAATSQDTTAAVHDYAVTEQHTAATSQDTAVCAEHVQGSQQRSVISFGRSGRIQSSRIVTNTVQSLFLLEKKLRIEGIFRVSPLLFTYIWFQPSMKYLLFRISTNH